MAQYDYYQSLPFAGVLADLESDQQVASYVNQEATAAMPFGIAVAQGAADQGCILMADTNSKILGLTIHDHAVDPYFLPTSPAKAGVRTKGTVSVLRQGRMYVIAEVAVAAQDPVFARYTVGAAPKDQLGGLGNTADTATAKQISQAVWLTSATATNIGVVDINLP